MSMTENETTTADVAAPPAEAATSTQGQQVVPLAQVQAMISEAVQKAHNAAFAESRRMFEGKKPKAQQQEAKPVQSEQPSVNELLELHSTFHDSVDSVRFPNKKAKAKMREEFLASRPQDPAAWISDYAETMGWVAQDSTQQPPQDQPKPKPSNARPNSDVGTPTHTTMGERPVDVTTWSREDFMADFRSKAKIPSNLYDIRNREYVRGIRRQAEADMAKKTFYIGPERK